MKSERVHKPKLEYLDALRAISFCAVFLQHVLGAYIRRDGIAPLEGHIIGGLFGISKFAVPMFVFLSGLVLFYQYYGRLDYFQFLRRRLPAILIPYGIWSVLYYYQMPLVGAQGASLLPKRQFLRLFLIGNVNYHTWYVFLLVQFYIFLPLIFWAFRWLFTWANTNTKKTLLLAALCVIYITALQLQPTIRLIPFVGETLYRNRAAAFPFYLPYFLAGGLAGLYPEIFLEGCKKYIKSICLIFCAAYGWLMIRLFTVGLRNGLPDINGLTTLRWDVFAYTMAAIPLVVFLGWTWWAHAGKNLKAVFRFLGTHSYTAYLSHAFFILFVSIKLLEFNELLSLWQFYIILTLSAFALTYSTAYLFDKGYGWVKKQIFHPPLSK